MNETRFHAVMKSLHDAERLLIDGWTRAATGNNEDALTYLEISGTSLAKAGRDLQALIDNCDYLTFTPSTHTDTGVE